MSGSIYGNLFRLSTWGESHGPGIGVVVDGCPAGLALKEDIQLYLDRRNLDKPVSTPRKEDDTVKYLGVFQGYTTGTPISLIVYNKDQRLKIIQILPITIAQVTLTILLTKYGLRLERR